MSLQGQLGISDPIGDLNQIAEDRLLYRVGRIAA
jgi:hypothetical protein